MNSNMTTDQRMRPRNAEQSRAVRRTETLRIPHLRLGALVALALAAFLAGLLLVSRGGDDAVPAPGSGPAAASESDLRSFAESTDHPVYWAGAKDDQTYELTPTTDGRVYVRYLPEGTEVGDTRSGFLTIGTYPRPSAYAELQRAAKAKGAVSMRLEDGGLAVYNESRPTSVYLGFPDARYQVEVYHPSPDEARRLALSGQVVPVE
jgi:hypothetical protein